MGLKVGCGVGRFISDEFTAKNGLKWENGLSLFNLELEYLVRGLTKWDIRFNTGDEISILGYVDELNLVGASKTVVIRNKKSLTKGEVCRFKKHIEETK